jgi:hypothetical protein
MTRRRNAAVLMGLGALFMPPKKTGSLDIMTSMFLRHAKKGAENISLIVATPSSPSTFLLSPAPSKLVVFGPPKRILGLGFGILLKNIFGIHGPPRNHEQPPTYTLREMSQPCSMRGRSRGCAIMPSGRKTRRFRRHVSRGAKSFSNIIYPSPMSSMSSIDVWSAASGACIEVAVELWVKILCKGITELQNSIFYSHCRPCP